MVRMEFTTFNVNLLILFVNGEVYHFCLLFVWFSQMNFPNMSRCSARQVIPLVLAEPDAHMSDRSNEAMF